MWVINKTEEKKMGTKNIHAVHGGITTEKGWRRTTHELKEFYQNPSISVVVKAQRLEHAKTLTQVRLWGSHEP